MERIEALRKEPLESPFSGGNFYYLFWKFFADHKQYGKAFYDAFSHLTPVIRDEELIVGRYSVPLTRDEEKEWESIYQPFFADYAGDALCGQDSHMAIDYELVLSCGIVGILNRIEHYSKECDSSKQEFYANCKICLEAVITFSEHYAICAEETAKQAVNETRRKELLEIARICRKVPKYPAESFYEAVQAVHFISLCLSMNPFRPPCCQQFQLGHPDRYLLSYYEKDMAEGKITKEFAQLLLDCLGIQINHRVHNGLSSGYMVGGRDKNGNIVANELTMMCMQVIDDIRLVYPAVGFCFTEGMDDSFLKKACEILSRGRSHPAIFNDDIITKGLMGYGVPEQEAHEYIHSTCVEITPVASSNVWVASPYTNMAQLLLDVLDREYDCFDALLSAVFEKLDNSIRKNLEIQCAFRQKRAERNRNPLLSCFVNDCLKTGTDIEQGGAKYNWIMPSFVGMANLVDALYVLKKLVFDEKEFTVKAFTEILERNFEGYENLRLRILKTIPKYGNDNDDIDQYFGIITEHIIKECKNYKGIHQNADLIPSIFCWIKHEYFGRETGATPDGRVAGFPLGDGSGPCQGREMNGPTASILSSTKWAHHELIGGVAVNMKFSKNSLGADSVATMTHLVKTFMKRGGFEIQINVVDKETLQKALKNPESYQDLIVRIGGYSDYFIKLSSEMQQEVILRTEHHI